MLITKAKNKLELKILFQALENGGYEPKIFNGAIEIPDQKVPPFEVQEKLDSFLDGILFSTRSDSFKEVIQALETVYSLSGDFNIRVMVDKVLVGLMKD